MDQYDTDIILSRVAKLLLSAGRRDVHRLSQEKITKVVEDAKIALAALSQVIAKSTAKKKSVVIPKFGMFVKKQSPTGSMIQFYLAPDFMKRAGFGLRMKDGAGRESLIGYQSVNIQYTEISQRTSARLTKDKCRKLIEGVAHGLLDIISESKGRSYISLQFGSLGELTFRKNVCNFEEIHNNPSFSSIGSQSNLDTYSSSSQCDMRSNNSRGSDFNSVYTPSVTSGAQAEQAIAFTAPESVKRLKQKLIERGGCNGIHSMGRMFRIMDDSRDSKLSLDELRSGIEQFGVRMNIAEVEELFTYFDRDASGTISFDELLNGLRGPMPENRKYLVGLAFDRMDQNNDGYVTTDDLEMLYDPSFNPDVQSGKRTKAEALRDFLSQFDGPNSDGIVTREEFEDYYKNISASIDRDDYFELMIRNAFHLAGGVGAAENTTNMRALVTTANGDAKVVTVADDFCRRPGSISNKEILNSMDPTFLNQGQSVNVERHHVSIEQRKQGHNPPRPPMLNSQQRRKKETTGPRATLLNESNNSTSSQGNSKTASKSRAAKQIGKKKHVPRKAYEENLFASTVATAGDQYIPNHQEQSQNLKVQRNAEKAKSLGLSRKSLCSANRTCSSPSESSRTDQLASRERDQATHSSEEIRSPLEHVATFLAQKGLSPEDLILRLGGNRVFGKCSMPKRTFVDGLVRVFPGSFSLSQAEQVARAINENEDDAIDVAELCNKTKGHSVLVKLKSELRHRHGMEGVHVLHRAFANAELYRKNSNKNNIEPLGLFDGMSDGSGSEYSNLQHLGVSLTHRELQAVLSFVCPSFSLTSQDMVALYSYFDANRDGVVSTTELLQGLAGPLKFTSVHRECTREVRRVWKLLDTSKRGYVTVQTIKENFDATLHPQVVMGAMSRAEAANSFVREMLMIPPTTATGPFGNTLPLEMTIDQPETVLPANIKVFREAFEMYYDDILAMLTTEKEFMRLLSISWKPLVRAHHEHNPSKTNQPTSSSQNRQPIRMDNETTRILGEIRSTILKQGGSDGIHKFSRILRIMDTNGDNRIDLDEFSEGMSHLGVVLSQPQLRTTFDRIDRDKSGHISLDELLKVLRGPMSKRRKKLVLVAFERLDKNNDGTITLEDIAKVYDPSFHPDVRSGRLQKRDALSVFLDQFDTVDRDGIVTKEEFEEYYSSVSASIDSDEYFELMMRNAWHISGGKGQTENTTNRRVLVTSKDGTQRVVEVKDDLWMRGDDVEAIHRHLLAAGQRDIANIGIFHSTQTKNKSTPVPARLGRKPQQSKHTREPQQSKHTREGHENILSWEEPPEETQHLAKENRQKELYNRTVAASRVQSLARAHKARKATSLLKNKREAQDRKAQDLQLERERENRGRILRPKGRNWY